ncbi:MAG: DUF5610 domain-containing protein [Candidatus Latescibacteria bacterium]|nr:hypothetical protein [Gemmatimonadaceae bacterium]MDP7449525.1 DUF5610 domain-containing protein [Candidatus Latescibacterota bacterium]
MLVGTTQSQSSLISSISASSKIGTSATSMKGGPADAVLMSVGRKIDVNYAQQVLETELGQSFASALKDAGIEGQALEDVLTGAIDVSPEATAKRIVDFATSFFGAFQANHADDEGSVQIDGFSQLIKDAVEEGFAQSRDVLEGIGKISGQVSDDIDETYHLVMGGIDSFVVEQQESLAPVPPPEEAPDDPLVL